MRSFVEFGRETSHYQTAEVSDNLSRYQRRYTFCANARRPGEFRIVQIPTGRILEAGTCEIADTRNRNIKMRVLVQKKCNFVVRLYSICHMNYYFQQHLTWHYDHFCNNVLAKYAPT